MSYLYISYIKVNRLNYSSIQMLCATKCCVAMRRATTHLNYFHTKFEFITFENLKTEFVIIRRRIRCSKKHRQLADNTFDSVFGTSIRKHFMNLFLTFRHIVGETVNVLLHETHDSWDNSKAKHNLFISFD